MKLLFICAFLSSLGCAKELRLDPPKEIYSDKKSEFSLLISRANESSLNYEFLSGAKCEVQGVVTRDAANVDPEIDIDDEGLGYPSYEYSSGDRCVVKIRIKVSFNPKLEIGDRMILVFSRCGLSRRNCKVFALKTLFKTI